MSILAGLALFLATIAFMEGFAYVVHRWVMHGGWAGCSTPAITARAKDDSSSTTFTARSSPFPRSSCFMAACRGVGRLGDLGRGRDRGLWRHLFRLSRHHRPSPDGASHRPALDLFQAHRPGAPAPPRGRKPRGDGQLRLHLCPAGRGIEAAACRGFGWAGQGAAWCFASGRAATALGLNPAAHTLRGGSTALRD